VNLHFTELGAGPPMVILHGLYGSGANWGQHARRLAADYRVLLPDLRNHGRSPHAEPMTYPAMAQDVLALLDAQGIERTVLIGHSMGGKAAMALALSAPERVRALVVADIAPVDYGPSDEHEGIIAAMRAVPLAECRTRQEVDAALVDGGIDTLMVRQFLLTNLVREGDAFHWRIPLATLAAALPALGDFPEPDGLYIGPTLFVHGGRSDYVRPEYEPSILQWFPQAQIETIDSAGHWLHVEKPDAFAAVLDDFLDEL